MQAYTNNGNSKFVQLQIEYAGNWIKKAERDVPSMKWRIRNFRVNDN